MANASGALIKALVVTAQIYGKEFSSDAATVLAGDLADFPDSAVIAALSRCRRELRFFPTVADIISRIDDGRPGAEEAWAMIPRDEQTSVVWTEEVRDAFGIIRQVLDDDSYAARTAFRETYLRLVSEARERKRPVRWEPSLGHDKHGREAALRQAVQLGRLTSEHAGGLLPHLEPVLTLVAIEERKAGA